MIQKRSPWLAVALLCGALVAACGSSSSTTSSSTTAASTPAAAATSSTPATSTSPAAPGGIVTGTAVADCRRAVQAATTLSATTKAKLQTICDKAANANPATLKKIALEVCSEVINASKLPAGPAKEQALAACKSVG